VKLNVLELSVLEIRNDFESKAYTAEQLTSAFLERICIYNPGYNAMVTMNPSAISDAWAIDRRRAAGEKLGPLAGVPVVIKDTMDFEGLPTTAGWAKLSTRTGGLHLVPMQDAPVVARLRQAGAIVLGKTNVPLLSLSGTNANDSWAGPTYNAADHPRAPGASSAGTATAIAGNFAVLGLAEETGGSIQNPAAAQGLVSIKPTFGLVPNTGVFPLATSTRDVVGPHARTVYDAALALDVLAGYTPEDPKTVASIGQIPEKGYAEGLHKDAIRGKRIGLYGPGWRKAPLSNDTRALYEDAIDVLRALQATVVNDPFASSDFSAIAVPSLVPGMNGYDARGEETIAYDLNNYLLRLGAQSPVQSVAELVAVLKEDPFSIDGILGYHHELRGFGESLNNVVEPPLLVDFLTARERYVRTLRKVMDEHSLDALVFPQMRAETPLLFSSDVILETTVSEINIGGFPGVTVPAGYYPSGSPFSLIFLGRLWDEEKILSFAYSYEQATQWRRTPALVLKPSGYQ
jgi:amidase